METIRKQLENKKRQDWQEEKRNEFLKLNPDIDPKDIEIFFNNWYNEIQYEEIELEGENVKVSKGFIRHPTQEYLTVTDEEIKNNEDYKKIKNSELLAKREVELSKLVITIDNGKQFNGSKEAIADLANALKTAEEFEKLQGMPLTSTQWRLYDNTIQTITIEEVREAYVKGNLQYSTKFIELSQGL